jgi:hypothetical protein
MAGLRTILDNKTSLISTALGILTIAEIFRPTNLVNQALDKVDMDSVKNPRPGARSRSL